MEIQRIYGEHVFERSFPGFPGFAGPQGFFGGSPQFGFPGSDPFLDPFSDVTRNQGG